MKRACIFSALLILSTTACAADTTPPRLSRQELREGAKATQRVASEALRASPRYYQADQLRETCWNGIALRMEHCETYIMGVIEGLQTAYQAKNLPLDFCLPPTYDGAVALKAAQTKFDRVRPINGESAASAVHRLLMIAFPCPE